jgi:hypothetical protein
MATSFSGGRSRSTRREPPTMGKQLVNFITCGCESSAPFCVIYKAGREPTTYWWLVCMSCWVIQQPNSLSHPGPSVLPYRYVELLPQRYFFLRYTIVGNSPWAVHIPIRLVFNTTFNSISVISWRSVLLVGETGVPEENHRPVASHCQTLSHNVVSSKPRLSGIRTHNVSGDGYLLHRYL